MKERFEAFLSTADSPATRDISELKELYKIASGKRTINCQSDTCIAKMLNEVRKYYSNNLEVKVFTPTPRKYTLKEGNHVFAPKGPAEHNNDNTSDADIEFYLKHYPHVKKLLVIDHEGDKTNG